MRLATLTYDQLSKEQEVVWDEVVAGTGRWREADTPVDSSPSPDPGEDRRDAASAG